MGKAFLFTGCLLDGVLQDPCQDILGILRVRKAEFNDDRVDVGLVGGTKGGPVKHILGVPWVVLFVFLEINPEVLWGRYDDRVISGGLGLCTPAVVASREKRA